MKKPIKITGVVLFVIASIGFFGISAFAYFSPEPHEHVLPIAPRINLEKTFIEKYNALTPERREAFDREADRIREDMARKTKERDAIISAQ